MPGADADLAAMYAAGVALYADRLGGTVRAAVSTAVGAGDASATLAAVREEINFLLSRVTAESQARALRT
jgi:hypothetical protein